MAFNSLVGTFQSPTVTGNQVISLTGLGGTPVAIRFFWVADSTLSGYTSDTGPIYNSGEGAATATAEGVRWDIYRHDGSEFYKTSTRNDACIYFTGTEYVDRTTVINQASFVSFANNQVTINWSVVAASGFSIGYQAFTGCDASLLVHNTDRQDVSSATPFGNGVEAIAHGLGTTPKAVLTNMSAFQVTTNINTLTNSRPNVARSVWTKEHGTKTFLSEYLGRTYRPAAPEINNDDEMTIELHHVDDTNIYIQGTAPYSAFMFALCLGGHISASLTEHTINTSTGTQALSTPLDGATPDAIMTYSAGNAFPETGGPGYSRLTGTDQSNDTRDACGVSDGTNQLAFGNFTNAGSSQTTWTGRRVFDNTALSYSFVGDSTNALDCEIAFVSTAADTTTINIVDAPPQGDVMVVLAIAETATVINRAVTQPLTLQQGVAPGIGGFKSAQGTFATPVEAGQQRIQTGLGVAPTAIILSMSYFYADEDGVGVTTTPCNLVMRGVATGPAAQGVTAAKKSRWQTGLSLRSDEKVLLFPATGYVNSSSSSATAWQGAASFSAELVSFNVDGSFTLDWDGVPATQLPRNLKVHYTVIGGTTCTAKTFFAPLSTDDISSPIAYSHSLGAAPKAVLCFNSAGNATSNTYWTTPNSTAARGSSALCHGVWCEDYLGTIKEFSWIIGGDDTRRVTDTLISQTAGGSATTSTTRINGGVASVTASDINIQWYGTANSNYDGGGFTLLFLTGDFEASLIETTDVASTGITTETFVLDGTTPTLTLGYSVGGTTEDNTTDFHLAYSRATLTSDGNQSTQGNAIDDPYAVNTRVWLSEDTFGLEYNYNWTSGTYPANQTDRRLSEASASAIRANEIDVNWIDAPVANDRRWYLSLGATAAITGSTLTVTATDTTSLTQSASRPVIPTVLTSASTLSLSQTADADAFYVRADTDEATLTLSQTAIVNVTLSLTASDVITVDHNEAAFTPFSTINTNTADHAAGDIDGLNLIQDNSSFFGNHFSASSILTLSQPNPTRHGKTEIRSGQSALTFTSNASARNLFLTASNTATITNGFAGRATENSAQNTLAMTHTASVDNARRGYSVITLGHTVVCNVTRTNLTASGAIGVSHAFTFDPVTFNACDYQPAVGTGSLVPASEPTLTRANSVTFQFPVTGPTNTVTLRTPQMGDVERKSFKRVVRETRGGTLKVFRDPTWPDIHQMVLTFVGIKEDEVTNIHDFMEASLGAEVSFTDWESNIWKGIILNPETPIVRNGRDNFDLQIEIELTESL